MPSENCPLCKKSPIYKSLNISDTDKKRLKLLVAADSFMIIGFLICIASTDIAPWKILAPILDFLQYPYRLFALATALIAVAAAIFVYCLTEFTNSHKLGMVVVTAAAVYIFMHSHSNNCSVPTWGNILIIIMTILNKHMMSVTENGFRGQLKLI